jgi:hypothetical protein
VEIVRRCYEAYAGDDPMLALAYFDPECEMDLRPRPDGRVFRGQDGVVEAARTWIGAWEDWGHIVEELIDAGDRVLVWSRDGLARLPLCAKGRRLD